MLRNLWCYAVSWFFELITPRPAITLPPVILPDEGWPDVTYYKELLMKRDAGAELQNKIRRELSAHPDTSGGEITCIDNDPDTGDLLVTGLYERNGETVQCTHRITITEEMNEGSAS